MRFICYLLTAFALAGSLARAQDANVSSPDGKVTIHFTLDDDGVPTYSVDFDGHPMLLKSHLGFSPNFKSDFTLNASAQQEVDHSWKPLFGERNLVPDHYRQLTIDLHHTSGQALRLIFRAYNEGAAFQYNFPATTGAQPLSFDAENTEFRFPVQTYAYEEHGTEGEYQRSAIDDIQPWCERPLTLEYANGDFACLTEADNDNFPRMLLSRLPNVSDALVSALGGNSSNVAGKSNPPASFSHVTIAAGQSSPWRVLLVAHKCGELLEHDYLVQDLCAPSAIADPSWIVPGKAMRDTVLSTANSKAIIDFAAEGGLQYLLFDDRWYGSEDPRTGDATTVRKPGLDLPAVIEYARNKNVGVWLYVDHRQIKTQRDKLFPLYEKWGIKGVKIGFVDVGPQSETAWIIQTIQRAAEHHLMLDIHDGYRDTGYSRTYPNLLTVEGVRGNEHHPTPTHNCTLPFTRFVQGAADYTICYMDKRDQTTHGQQLAMAVAYFSPYTMLYWYDRPAQVLGRPELEWFRHVPTVWDETRVIDGQIGKYAAVARRSGQNWFIGAITNESARQIDVPLSFLGAGRYTAHLYTDSETPGAIAITTKPCSAADSLHLDLKSGGGAGVWLEAALAAR